METRYTAFISYKHAPADIAVASEIQKRLERYHIPAAIRKKTGKEKIGRIFRDKEELPITSDLSDDISRALEEADFLIVICSSSTKLSTWVPREISYFLRNHTKKQVLTVLVDGEPNDVIPKELLTDTVERTAPDGTSYQEEIIYEPLSCDFREGIKTARRTEIPRLAAALLGCSYDELVRRERQYKRRRAMAIGIPAACALAVAVGYLIWSRQEIAKNYEQAQANLNQALINQSEYLGKQAKNFYDDGDRLRALLLALEALPSEDNERPLTSNAKEHLAMALRAYRPHDVGDEKDNLTDVAEFAAQGDIETIYTTDDGHYLIVRDSYESAYIWDLDSYKLVLLAGSRAPETVHGTDMAGVWRVLDDENIVSVKALSDSSVVFLTERGISACDLSSGEIVWSYTDEAANWPEAEIGVSYDGNEVCAAVPVEEENGDGGALMLTVDSGDGALLSRSEVMPGIDTGEKAKYIRQTGDGKYAAAVMTGQNGGLKILLWKKESAELNGLDLGEDLSVVQDMSFSDDNRLVVMGWNGEADRKAYASPVVTVTSKRDINVSAFDPETLGLFWENRFQSPQINRLKEGKGVFIFDDQGPVVCCYANKTAVFDLADGSLNDEVECPAPLVDAAVNVSDIVVYFLEDGSVGAYDYTVPGETMTNCFFNYPLEWLKAINRYGEEAISYLVQPDSSRIWLCKEVYDEDHNRFGTETLPEDFRERNCVVTDNAVFLTDNKGCVHIYDPAGEKPAQHVTLEGDISDYYYIGEENSKDRLWYYYFTGYAAPDCLVGVSAGDGRVERVVLREGVPKEIALAWLNGLIVATGDKLTESLSNDTIEIFSSGRARPKMTRDGRFAWADGEDLNIGFVEDGDLKIERSVPTGVTAGRIFVSPDAKRALVCDLGETAELEKLKDASAYKQDSFIQQNRIVDLTSGEVTDVSLTLHGLPMDAVWNDDASLMAVTDGEEVEVRSFEGQLLYRFSQPGRLVVSAAMHEGELLILFSEGVLTRYDLTDGRIKGQSYVSHYHKYTEVGDSILVSDGFTNQMKWTFFEDKLIMSRYDSFSLLHIIDLSDWGEELATDNVYAYDSARDRLISSAVDPETKKVCPGWFEHYTVEELRKKAEIALHGMTLTDEERASYGLGSKPVPAE